MVELTIGDRFLGPGRPTYVVAEVSANHGGSLEHALELVDAIAETGADAVKLQTYTPDTMTIDSDQKWFRIEGTQWAGRSLYDLYREAQTPWEWHAPIKERVEAHGLDFFSTPFDASAVDFLQDLGVAAFKIASFELVDIPLVRRVAATGKPVIMSTGMATLAEIDEAVRAVRGQGNERLVLLKCTSAYPALPEEMALGGIPTLATAFETLVGLSDHSMTTAVPVAAVALGASLVEKHVILSREEGGPDAAFSLEPAEFAAMVSAVRTAEAAIRESRLGAKDKESGSKIFRRSIFVVQDVERGERFTSQKIRSIRPGHGLHPRHFEDVVGKVAARPVRRGTPLDWSMVVDAEGDG